MRKIVGLIIFLLIISVAFAQSGERATDRREDIRERARTDARERVENRIEENVKENIVDVAKDRIKDNMMDNVRDRIAERKMMRDKELERLATLKDEIAKALKRREAKNVKERVKEKVERKCEEVDDKVERAVCDKEKVAYHAIEKVRERQNLSEQCRALTGQTRSGCEENVNKEFRNATQERFKEWVKAKRLRAASGGNETENTDDNESARVRLDLIHKKMLENKLNETKEETKKALINRLGAAIDKAEKVAEYLEKAMSKAEEKGHDVQRLEFLLEEYNSAVDKAKVLFDDEQYRDSLAALNDAKQTFKEFRKTFAEILDKHKHAQKYVETDETENETPPQPETNSTAKEESNSTG